MQYKSELYETILAGNHRFEVKVNIAGTDYGMDKLTAMRSSASAFGEGEPRMGLAPSGELMLSLYLDSASVPRMAKVRPFVRVVNDKKQSEWLQKGVFYVDTREQDQNGLLTLTCFDAMLLACRPQPFSALSWPALDTDVVNEIASILGITLDARTLPLMDGGFRIPLPASYTMRETLQHIAALYGGSFVITDLGQLRLLPLFNATESVPVESAFSIKRAPDFPACSGVRFLVDSKTEVFAGDETGYVFELDCPCATQASVDRLLTKLQGFVYRPYRAEKAILDPACELGDSILLPGETDLFRQLLSLELRFDSLCAADLSAPGETALDHEFPYESPETRRYTRRLDSVESELSLQAGQIAAKVSRTGGDPSSFGWYLDADRFSLLSDGSEVLRADEDGIRVTGAINATSGEIGGCSIVEGNLVIQNANIENINASKITAGTLSVARIGSKSITGAKLQDYTISSGKMSDGSAVNRVIGQQAVSYAKTSFQDTLDLVGVNKANIDTISGYFTGSANFNALLAISIALNGHQLSLETIPIGGVDRKVVCWT